MRVKRLDLLGFKSFSTNTSIHFEPGVTAIVGPNGSGKSNIVDGIRWVLGEHNPRDVRAPRLEDVIFNGTDTRAPLSMAEVSLTIDNAQGLLPINFAEVAITRRVYRSGESEYLINQAPCRLRDIQELFLGTGLGGGTYAIIEQGHIDLVLSSKPEERRVVFEEASGIAKYLAKKKETMRRLDEAEEHLVRIVDIISEVRRQVNALERQASKARRYRSQWEQLKSLELRLAVDELRAGQSRFGEAERRVAELTARRQELDVRKQACVSAIDERNAAVSALQGTLRELRAQLAACASELAQHESQAALKQGWIDELKQQAVQLEQEAAQLASRARAFEEQLARVGGGESELATQDTELRRQLQTLDQDLIGVEQAMTASLETITQAKTQLFEAAAEATHQRNAVAQLGARLHALEAQVGRLEGQRTQLDARAQDVEARRDAAQQEQQALRAQHEELSARAGAAQQALEAAAARRHELVGRLHQSREQLAGERTRVGVLEDLWRRYEGFPEAVRSLMSGSVQGIVGPLADLLQASPGYEEVVEAALGPLSDALVVRDRAALAQCRRRLREQGIEACRFLVLEDCPSAAPQAAGTGAAVKQFVRAEASYRPLVEWLLDDAVLVEDFERILQERATPTARLVSRRGERWDRRSWRLGGAEAPSNGGRGMGRRFGRKQRWETARAGLQALEASCTQIEDETRDAEQAWQRLLAEQESAKAAAAHALPGVQKLTAQLEQLTEESGRIADEQKAVALELDDLATERREAQEALAASRQATTEAETRQQTLERALTDAQTARETTAQRQQELSVGRAQVEARLRALEERLGTLRSRRHELESERGHLTTQAEQKQRQRTEGLGRIQELEGQIAAHRQEGAGRSADRSRFEAEAAQLDVSLREAEARRDEALPALLEVERQLAGVAQDLQTHQQQLSERQFRRERIVERLRELYQIDEATLEAELRAEAAPLTDDQRRQMTGQAQELRAKLEGMGPVSLGSVEEYDELKRRLDFLQTQQQDLASSRDDLKSSITQINRTARAQFRETFEKIKVEFQHYFARLFNGGQADLQLLDEDDVLESGIEIVARPPGKRLQSISLLSGGERALAAIALLFALFKVRPSPFCILDEIDAPLDEANVDRFTRVLEEFLSLSQFILITHNKKTITKADILYGVTMEEAGISKILSAKLGNGGRPAASRTRA